MKVGWVLGWGGRCKGALQWQWGILTISEKMEMAQNWQRTPDILRERVPETRSKSFVLPVTPLMFSTSCTFQFPIKVGLDVVTSRAATVQTLCISGWSGAREELPSVDLTEKQRWFIFCFCLNLIFVLRA